MALKTYRLVDSDTKCEIALVEATSAEHALDKYAPSASQEFRDSFEVRQLSHNIPESSHTVVIP
jgi:hypothetical protein